MTKGIMLFSLSVEINLQNTEAAQKRSCRLITLRYIAVTPYPFSKVNIQLTSSIKGFKTSVSCLLVCTLIKLIRIISNTFDFLNLSQYGLTQICKVNCANSGLIACWCSHRTQGIRLVESTEGHGEQERTGEVHCKEILTATALIGSGRPLFK